MDTRELADSIALFAGLDDDAIRGIVAVGNVWVLPPDTPGGLREGEPGEALYVILDGAVKRFASGRGGREVIFGMETTGAWFGEVALIDGGVRGTSVMTTARTRLWSFRATDFAPVSTAIRSWRRISSTASRARSATSPGACAAWPAATCAGGSSAP
ncbi:MAG: cyclic nucleotide-binding domain-containing protein [Gammaproteobacteria bacterium]|nr:cyclic nucleotide-binding domain-containing protein [Gammaproteobacteria bacterium]